MSAKQRSSILVGGVKAPLATILCLATSVLYLEWMWPKIVTKKGNSGKIWFYPSFIYMNFLVNNGYLMPNENGFFFQSSINALSNYHPLIISFISLEMIQHFEFYFGCVFYHTIRHDFSVQNSTIRFLKIFSLNFRSINFSFSGRKEKFQIRTSDQYKAE